MLATAKPDSASQAIWQFSLLPWDQPRMVQTRPAVFRSELRSVDIKKEGIAVRPRELNVAIGVDSFGQQFRGGRIQGSALLNRVLRQFVGRDEGNERRAHHEGSGETDRLRAEHLNSSTVPG
jgi:hypothetical protein